MNLKNVNSSLLLKKQDSRDAVLLLFVFALPFSALLPHAHVAAAVWTVGALLLFRPVLSVPPSRKEGLFFLLLLLTLTGAVLSASGLHALLHGCLRLAFFLPHTDSRRRTAMENGLLLSGGVLGALSLLSLFLGYGRTGYTDLHQAGELARAAPVLGNPNVTAAFLLLPTLLSLERLLWRRASARRCPALAVFLLGTGGICATFSRGALLALALGTAVLVMQRIGPFHALLLFFSALPLLSLLLPAALGARILSILSPDSSVLYRFSLWRSILRLPLSSLLFGAGEGKRAMTALLSPVLAAGLLHVEHPHSLFFHLLLADGIAGLLLFFLFSAAALRKSPHRGATAAVLAFLGYGFFDDPLYAGQTEVIFWLSYGLL